MSEAREQQHKMVGHKLGDFSEQNNGHELIIKLRAEYELEQLTSPVPSGRRYAKRQTYYEGVDTETLLDTMRRILRGDLSTALGMFGRRLWSGASSDDEMNIILREFIGRGLDREGFALMVAEHER